MTHSTTLRRFGGQQFAAFILSERVIAAVPAVQQISISGPENVRVVLEFPQGSIAVVAQQTPQFPRLMAVVKGEASPAIIASADITLGRGRDYGSLGQRQAIFAHSFLDIADLRIAAITGIVRSAALFAVLRPIFAHAPIFALSASRLTFAFGDVFKPIIGGWFTHFADAANFRFHPITLAESRTSSERRIAA